LPVSLAVRLIIGENDDRVFFYGPRLQLFLMVSATDARRLSASSGVLCLFFTEAEKISVEIFNIEVLAAPWSLFE